MENNYRAILEDNIEKRGMADKPLINFFLLGLLFFIGVVVIAIICVVVFPDMGASYDLLLEFLASLLGALLVLYMIYIQTNRVNAFIERKTEWYKNIVEFTNQHSEDSRNVTKLNDLITAIVLKTHVSPINLNNALIFSGITSFLGVISLFFGEGQVQMSILIGICTIGTLMVNIIIYEYPINAIWDNIQCFENEFDSTLSKVWKENGWIEQSIEFYIDPRKKRNYVLWLFFSMISFGIMFVVWVYKIYTDPDSMYKQFHDIEDKIIERIKIIEKNKITTNTAVNNQETGKNVDNNIVINNNFIGKEVEKQE